LGAIKEESADKIGKEPEENRKAGRGNKRKSEAAKSTELARLKTTQG